MIDQPGSLLVSMGCAVGRVAPDGADSLADQVAGGGQFASLLAANESSILANSGPSEAAVLPQLSEIAEVAAPLDADLPLPRQTAGLPEYGKDLPDALPEPYFQQEMPASLSWPSQRPAMPERNANPFQLLSAAAPITDDCGCDQEEMPDQPASEPPSAPDLADKIATADAPGSAAPIAIGPASPVPGGNQYAAEPVQAEVLNHREFPIKVPVKPTAKGADVLARSANQDVAVSQPATMADARASALEPVLNPGILSPAIPDDESRIEIRLAPVRHHSAPIRSPGMALPELAAEPAPVIAQPVLPQVRIGQPEQQSAIAVLPSRPTAVRMFLDPSEQQVRTPRSASEMPVSRLELPANVPAQVPSALTAIAHQTAAIHEPSGLQASASEAPIDFAQLVDRLLAAREAAVPGQVRISLDHADFGKVSLAFAADPSSLNVTIASADPEFVRAVETANQSASAAPQAEPVPAATASSRQGDSTMAFAHGQGQSPSRQHAPDNRPAANRASNPSPQEEPGEGGGRRRGIFA